MQSTCRGAVSDNFDAIVAINREPVPGVAELERAYFTLLVDVCEHFRVIEVDGETAGYIFAMNQDAAYTGEEFQWFCRHLSEMFLYIDQVAIGKSWRGMRLGTALYEDLEEHAARSCVNILACEVNYDPPNKESQAFHRRFGFREVSRMDTRSLIVSLMTKRRLGRET